MIIRNIWRQGRSFVISVSFLSSSCDEFVNTFQILFCCYCYVGTSFDVSHVPVLDAVKSFFPLLSACQHFYIANKFQFVGSELCFIAAYISKIGNKSCLQTCPVILQLFPASYLIHCFSLWFLCLLTVCIVLLNCERWYIDKFSQRTTAK